MEALARGHREWAAPFVDSREVLDRLAALPWAKARKGWKLVSYSAHFDTLTCAHPVMGRLTLYAAQSRTGYKVTAFDRAAPPRRRRARR